MINKKLKRVTCYFCKKPVHINKFGGFFNPKGDKEEIFCNNIVCLIQLTDWEKVNQIREFYKNKTHSTYDLAKIFGVARQTIGAVIHYKNWNYNYINDNPQDQKSN